MNLYIDLEKAIGTVSWREEIHPRDKFGKFSSIKGGSSVVTHTGKTGTVEKVDGDYYHVRHADGKKSRVKRSNVIHANDHKKIMDAQAKTKKRKASAAVGQTTKAANRANGTGKATEPKLVLTSGKKQQSTKVKAMEQKATAENKANRRAKKERDLSAPDILRKPIEQGTTGRSSQMKNTEQSSHAEDYKDLENNPEATSRLDEMWNSKEAKALMKKEPGKRSEADIRRIAGDMTTQNDRLAYHTTLQMGKARGMNLLSQVNRIEDVGPSGDGEVHNQETGYYGDLLQTARASMYETLYRVMSGSQNPGKDTNIGAHVISRMKQKLHKDMYALLNEVPAPHEIRGALADLHKGEAELIQSLGHTPSMEELANHLQQTSAKFKSAPIMDNPTYDEKTGQWVATKKRITDPVERLKTLQAYRDRQKTSTLDKDIDGEEGTAGSAAANVKSTEATPDEQYEQKERQKELKTAIPKVLQDIGLSSKEKLVFMVMFGSPSAKINKGNMTLDEVAEAINRQGGYEGGKQATKDWVNKYYRSAMVKLSDARTKNHPALKELAMMKSLVFNLVMKSLYEYDLVKSLNSWGIGTDILVYKQTRIATADNLLSLQKSMAPQEYIGSIVYTEGGELHARIVEFGLPEDNELYKSFNSSLEKSMFPHKGKQHEVNKKMGDYVKANAKKYSSLSEAQHGSAKKKSSGHTWSEELLLKNPGSAWITWGGKRVLVNTSDGNLIYDSANEVHREEHNQGAPEDKIDFHHEQDTGHKDAGIEAFKEDMEGMRKSWRGDETDKDLGIRKTYLREHEHKGHHDYANFTEDEQKAYESMSEDERKKFLGNRYLGKEGVKEALQKYRDSGDTEADRKEAMDALSKAGSMAGKNAKMMIGKTGNSGLLAQVRKGADEDTIVDLLGQNELTRAKEEASKKLLPDGTYLVGNPLTGKTIALKIKNEVTKAGQGGAHTRFGSTIAEVFDPDGGQHEDLNTWGGLGKALGYTGADASGLQDILAKKANSEGDKPFMKQIDEAEYAKARSNTKLGLQEGMAHKDFKLVNQSRNKKGEVTSHTYAQDMPDGTQNTVMVDAKGTITDPVMARLLKQRKPIANAGDLHEVMQGAVGNRAWVTAHSGSGTHVSDSLGHHIQLEYDGKGAPRVVGGEYDSYRFMDTNDIPKGAVDPATGEPIKALFKGGKLVDRGLTTKNKVAMKEGNAVLYPGEKGFRKGRIHAIEGDTYKVTDGKGHVIGMFKKSELKQASEEGRTLSASGQSVVKTAKTGTHRMDTTSTFKADNPKDQKKVDKVKELFSQALQKAGINSAFDKDGVMNNQLELSDAMMKQLTKRLGRSKAGKELLKQFKSAYTKELEIHVPEAMRDQVSTYGVRVLSNGTAKISAGKFEELREALGGLSVSHDAREHLAEHFNRKDRKPKSPEELQKAYQPNASDSESAFGQAYQAQFKPGGRIMKQGLYSTQLAGVSHLVERGRGIVGHGMGTGKTITGVAAALHEKAKAISEGRKPGKTLVVSPAGIQSDWGKEIGGETNSRALYIGSEGNLRKKDSSGNWMKSEGGRHMFGQEGTEQEAVSSKHFVNNISSIGSEDHDFHIMSYDQFMKHRDVLSKSGLYDNIIVDEIHAFKNQGRQRGKSLAETTDSFKNVWGLSGTPMENDAREVHSLIDTVTGGRHELGTAKEFTDKFLMKDKNGKVIGVKPAMADKLGDIVANIVQFRGSEDVQYSDRSKIHFPHIIGSDAAQKENAPEDFMSNMADRNRDHKTTDYYGTKHSVFDFESGSHEVTGKNGETYTSQTTSPTNLSPAQQKFYNDYHAVQKQYLPDAKLQEMVKASATGYDNTEKGETSKNYLTAMQKLQKHLNAPLASRMYVPGGGSALDSGDTDVQAVAEAGAKAKKVKSGGLKPYNPVTGEGHYKVDEHGNKRYFESDGEGSFKRNSDGSPKLLPPMHHNNPKAEYMKQRISTYLDSLATENEARAKAGKPELMPKVVVKSSYTTFGTDVADGVIRDLQREHPHLAYWADKLQKQGQSLAAGQFTGEAKDREETKTGFRGNKNSYAKDQGNMWATTVSPAGKEGVDFGNAHLMLMMDQDWNPQKMAQFTARVRRSDSATKGHEQVGRANSVRIESLHMPGTIEDFMFNAEDIKMGDIQRVTKATRDAEEVTKFGDSESKISSTKNFTRSQKRRAGAKPKGTTGDPGSAQRPKSNENPPTQVGRQVAKALKLVVIL